MAAILAAETLSLTLSAARPRKDLSFMATRLWRVNGRAGCMAALFLLTFALVWLPLGHGSQAAAGSVDYSIYAQLLMNYVRDGLVDYQGLSDNDDLLEDFLDMMAEAEPEEMSGPEQFAYYLNAYNAWTLKLVLRKYPDVSNTKVLGSLFVKPEDVKFVRIGKEEVSLGYIENEMLRARFQDPRIIFALCDASISSPPLRAEPYLPDSLEYQLDDATRNFINNHERNYLKGRVLYLSRVFFSHKEEFPQGIIKFVLKYALGAMGHKLAAIESVVKINSLPHDWSLNDIQQSQ
jgi:hypothetical protein